jgi:hypothetical protein
MERNKMTTQRQHIYKLVKLMEEHPEREIHVCVDNDGIAEWGQWTAQKIKAVRLGYWYRNDERIYTEVEDVIDELEELYDREVDTIEAYDEMEPAILVYTVPG